jgi:hypothetical protein
MVGVAAGILLASCILAVTAADGQQLCKQVNRPQGHQYDTSHAVNGQCRESLVATLTLQDL